MTLFVLALVLPPFWVSFLATAGMRWLAPRLGLIDKPAARKVHVVPTALGGGLAIWLGVVVPVFAIQLAIGLFYEDLQRVLPPQISVHLAGATYRGLQLWIVLLGGTVLAVMGLIDDFRPISWKPRIFVQFFVAIAVAVCGVRATLFLQDPIFGAVASVLWMVVLVNSFNFLDNMDGLSGGIGLVVCLVFASIMLFHREDPRWLVGGFFLVLAGSILGFLCHNWSPARIFMGDSGSYFIGFCVASMTIVGTFYRPLDQGEHVMMAPLCVLAVPLYDILSVILIRLKEGRSPFQPDKKHFSHRLVALGFKPVRAVLTIHLITLTTGLMGLLLYSLPGWREAWLALAVVVCLLSIIAILESVRAPALAGPPVAPADTTLANHLAEPQHQTPVSAGQH